MEKLLTAKQLSDILGVDLSTVYLWTHTEFIPHYKLGRALRFRETDVRDWVERRKIQGRDRLKYPMIERNGARPLG
jgi:excisionase family DNA binding protein